MPIPDPILVFLAHGTQGRAVVRLARQRGHRVRALVRRLCPDDPFLSDCVLGDLDDPASLAAAAQGCGHAILQVPTAETSRMVRQVRNAVTALRRAGVRSVILKLASASRPAPCPEPSFVVNAAIESHVRMSGMAFAVIRPTMYLDNLLKPAVRTDMAERGIFSPPIAQDQRIAWTNVDDCALAAIILLERGLYGGDHRIAGPESVRGDELAHRLSIGLNRPIAYHAEPIDLFVRDVETAMGPDMARRIASKFRYFRDHRPMPTEYWPPARITTHCPASRL